jgi:hypothetical protein
MTLQEAGIREWVVVVLKPFGDRQTVRQRLFCLGNYLSAAARASEVGQWPGYHVWGTYLVDGVGFGVSTADIERAATDEDLRRTEA